MCGTCGLIKAEETTNLVKRWPEQLFSSSTRALLYLHRIIQFTVFSVASSGRITREPQMGSPFVSVAVELLSHIVLHSAETGDGRQLHEAAHLRALRMPCRSQPPLLLPVQLSRFHILAAGLFVLTGRFSDSSLLTHECRNDN